MRKTLSWRFWENFGQFHMLRIKAFSEIALFREFSNQDFDSLQLWKYMSYDDHLFCSKCLKFDVDSIIGRKN